jgi:hypothetical protein
VTVSEARRGASTRPAAVAPAPRAAGSRWPTRLGIAALVALYIFGWGATGLAPINQTDLDAFFLPSARIALAGHPLQVYALRYDTLYPNANGPLSLVPLTAVAALAARLGWLDDIALRRMLVMAAFSVFSLLLAREGVAAVDRLRGNPPRGLWRVLTYAVFACTPMLWHSVLLYGHIEQPMTLWLTLWSVRSLAGGRPRRAGLTLGLAMLGRSMAVVYLLALLVLLCARRRWWHGLWLGAAAAGAVTVGLLPFYLADRADLIFSLATFRGALPIGGGSIWALAVGGPFENLGQAYDGACVLAYAVLISVVVALVRRDLGPRDRDVYGLLMLAGMSFPLLIKTVWPYYFLDLYVLSAAWWLAAPGPWASVRRWVGLLWPLGFAACGAVAEYGSWLSIDQPERIRESVVEFVALAVITLVFGGWLLLRARGGPALPAAGVAGLAEQPSLG